VNFTLLSKELLLKIGLKPFKNNVKYCNSLAINNSQYSKNLIPLLSFEKLPFLSVDYAKNGYK
jgi:hypothetical protein